MNKEGIGNYNICQTNEATIISNVQDNDEMYSISKRGFLVTLNFLNQVKIIQTNFTKAKSNEILAF